MGTADKDYFLNRDGELAEGEADAAILLVRKGQDIPKDMADKYGIGKVAQEEAAVEEPVEEKAAQPSSNKAKAPSKNKGAK